MLAVCWPCWCLPCTGKVVAPALYTLVYISISCTSINNLVVSSTLLHAQAATKQISNVDITTQSITVFEGVKSIANRCKTSKRVATFLQGLCTEDLTFVDVFWTLEKQAGCSSFFDLLHHSMYVYYASSIHLLRGKKEPTCPLRSYKCTSFYLVMANSFQNTYLWTWTR